MKILNWTLTVIILTIVPLFCHAEEVNHFSNQIKCLDYDSEREILCPRKVKQQMSELQTNFNTALNVENSTLKKALEVNKIQDMYVLVDNSRNEESPGGCPPYYSQGFAGRSCSLVATIHFYKNEICVPSAQEFLNASYEELSRRSCTSEDFKK